MSSSGAGDGRAERRSHSRIALDEGVRRALRAFSEEQDPYLARLALRRELARMSEAQRTVLVARLAEVSLGQLTALLARREEGPSGSLRDD